jgi:hypothetical protein
MKFTRPTRTPSALFGTLVSWISEDRQRRVTHHTDGPGGYTAWRFFEWWDKIDETYYGGWKPISYHRTRKAAMRACARRKVARAAPAR